jgi:hypothetical protein
MANVDAYGLAQAGADTGAVGAMTYGAGGLAEAAVEVYGQGNLTFAGLGLADCEVEALGQFVSLVKIASVVAVSATKVRVTFDRRMKKDAALLAAYNYSVTPQTGGAASVTINSVEPESATNPLWVDLITSEMTDGATYRGEVSTSGPTDTEGTPVDPNNNYVDYTGVGEAPTIHRVIPQSANRVDVQFNESMKSNDDILNPAKYTWDNGLSTLNVLEVDGDTVKLVTSEQVPGTLYTLTITP